MKAQGVHVAPESVGGLRVVVVLANRAPRLKHERCHVLPLQAHACADGGEHGTPDLIYDDGGGSVGLVAEQRRVLDLQKLPDLVGHGGEDLRRR